MRNQYLAGLCASIIAASTGLFLHLNPPDIYDGGGQDFSVEWADGIMCDSDRECEEATGYPYDTAMEPNPPKYPVLVGINCVDAGGPLYAFEEDHFPEGGCREIWPMDWDWQENM